MKISIVLPVYNEGGRVGNVIKSLIKTNYEIILVDDGSNRGLILNKSFQRSSKIKLLVHKVNMGKGAALKTGCRYAFSTGSDAVIMMDSDGQHSVDDLSKFVTKLETGKYDVVLGSRNLSLGVPLVRFVGNKIASVVVNILFGIYVSDVISGYRALTRSAYETIKWESLGYGVETEMIIKIKMKRLRYCEVPVETIYFDKYKGVSILDAFEILFNIIYWRLKI